ncbi:NAD(P)/FAD-dependent oxidoreductase [Iodobacter fluviatilis]|uniref:NADH dehydrogenase n=1 Tax=Iodobacter fluviatilis TaxID=537 RepID=A0A377Q3E4_9NEIS|nr:NAD(P)/FAD-dependent oxidoreductase [Iodobacter fluviatilis]TCU82698.1 NADH dehydrogenase [Iodobacter fluviatilis]STQ89816.1 NADH dehydrogenase [Iodobacter fluviatilis]
MTALQRIVIVGGGAGGLELAVKLGEKLGRKGKAHITLIDAARTHIWKPLLHQVAAGTLDSHADELEYIALARWHHFDFRLGRMTGLDRETKQVVLAPTLDEEDGSELVPEQTIAYDALVMALGSQTNDFGTPGVANHAIMLDTPEAAERFNKRFINSCLRAQARRKQAGEGRFTVTIIGGGATGVELSAELHMATRIMSSFGFANIHPERDLKIVIVDAAPRLLSALPERLSDAVALELRKMAVEIHANERVVDVSAAGVKMASGKFIPSDLVVWAAGIKAADFLKEIAGLESNRLNQLVVSRTLQTSRDPSIFALGDCAACPLGDAGATVPPRAQSAHQQAMLLAKSIPLYLAGKPLPEFKYQDYGSLVSLGEYSTVGSLMGGIARGSVFIEGQFAKMMYWSLYKKHQVAVNGWFKTWLATWGEYIDRVSKPRIKLH